MTKRTKLKDRILPIYTKGEEIFNMTSHIVGVLLGIVAIVLCSVFAAIHHNVYGVVSGVIYGVSLVVLYTMSSVYHGLSKNLFAKRVFQVLDHCTIFIMIAGFGAYFEQQFGMHSLIGSSILALICYLVCLKDVAGLIKVSQYIVPLLIGSLLIIGVFVIDAKNVLDIAYYVPKNTNWKWILDSVLYGSYNTILLIPVLIALRNLISNRKEQGMISVLTAIFIIFLSFIVFFMLGKINGNIQNLEMPAVYVASKISPIFEYLYGFIILSSILTTSISLGTSLLENIANTKEKYKQYAILICISSILVSNIGFSNLVNLLYPIFGYIGLVQIIKISTQKSKS